MMHTKAVFLYLTLLLLSSVNALYAQSKKSTINTVRYHFVIHQLAASDSSAAVSLEIYNKAKKLIQVEQLVNVMEHPKDFHDIVILDEIDWNFDGSNDVVVTIHYDFLRKESVIFAFLFDNKLQKFKLNKSFTNFLNSHGNGKSSRMVLHEDQNLFRHIEVRRENYRTYSDYRFIKDELIIIRKVVEDAETDRQFVIVTKKELINDVWKESTRKVPYQSYKWTD